MNFRRYLAYFVAAAALALPPLAAVPVAVGDFSFEGGALPEGILSNNIGPSWTGTSGATSASAFVEYMTGFTAEGTTHLRMEPGYDVWQDLTATYQANTLYTLKVAVGNRDMNYTQSGNQSQYLLADSTGSVYATAAPDAFTYPLGTFVAAPDLVMDTASNPAAVGKTIRILLRARGAGRSHFDRVRLDATAGTPVGAASIQVLAATAVTATTATLRGAITASGTSAPSVTFFWGTTQGGTVAANWQNSITLPGTQSGNFSSAISGLTPARAYYFAARASNSSGISWSVQGAFESLPLPATVSTVAATAILGTSATLGANVSATGGAIPAVTLYYGTTDGGTTATNWASTATLGSLNGASSIAVSGLQVSTTYYFRAFAQNSGGGSWAPASSSFTTLATQAAQVANVAATGITGTTATLRGEVIQSGNEPPSLTIFYGTTDGGATTAWSNSANVGVDSGNFTRFVAGLTPNTTYFFRCRAINTSGTSWAPSSSSFTTTALVNSTPLIHEIHYNPADDVVLGPLPLEFIELHNPGDATVDLSNWRLTSGVTFTFPAATLAPGGYLVIAQDPAAVLSKYGVTALGPWLGKLSNSGDTIELRDSTNVIKDSVSYQPGFPWPTSANGLGPSIELINSALDNDLGGSWRSSTSTVGTVTYVGAAAFGWSYFKGISEPLGFFGGDWRLPSFWEIGWSTGQAPIGYGTTVPCNTVLADMSGTTAANYSTVYARKSFVINAGQVPDKIILKIRHDDGCIVWINNTEVYRGNMSSGNIPFNGLATEHVSDSVWTTRTLTGASAYLNGGTNVIAIQGANITKDGSSDFNIDAELIAPATGGITFPTPGAANSTRRAANSVPPQARQVTHTPNQPTAGVPVTITARITDPDGVGYVNLGYQWLDPGAYIRKTDPAFLTAWANARMLDNGTGGDLVAGDSIFTYVIPASEQIHRRIIRYKLRCTDTLGNSQDIPYADDEQPNFAYFVYNGAPAWTGTLRPGAPAVTYPAATINGMQTYHIVANATDVTNSQYVKAFERTQFPGALVYDGVVYDHIQFKIRGNGSAYISGKNKWNIYFNRSRDLVARDNWGKKYAQTWNNLLLNANASPWSPANRGSAGIEEASSIRLYELAGNTSFRSNYAQLRVIDDAVETSPTDQFTGDLWGLYLVIEPLEGNLLKERGLPDGNMYSMLFGQGNKKHQAAGQPVDSSDLDSFQAGLQTSGQTEAWYRSNMDMDKLYTFMAINRLIGNADAREDSNMIYYHRSSDNKWELIGYDYDMMYVAAHHWGSEMDGVMVAGQPGGFRAIMRHPALAQEFRNRCREIMSLLASDGAADGGQIGQLLHEYASMVHPTGQTATWANLDAAMWNLNERSRGPVGTNEATHYDEFFRATMIDVRGFLQGMYPTYWRRTLPDGDGDGFSDFPSQLQWFVNFATNTYPATARPWFRRALTNYEDDTDLDRQKGYGYKYLEWETLHGGFGNANAQATTTFDDFPNRPTVTATGNPAFPTTGLTFSSSAFSDPQGPGTFSAWQWRIAEISAPGIPGYLATKPSKYEIETLATSAELTTAPGSFTIPLGVTTAGKTYRVRVRHKDTAGNWGHWSTPAHFAATTPVVTLVHYWNFNTPASQLIPTQTLGGGAITTTLTGSAALASDTANSFAAVNARNGDVAGSHLRVNNPLTATLNFALPTTGYQNVLVQYETRRSTQGAGIQAVSYTLDGTNFTLHSTYPVTDGTPEVKILDFRDIPAADNNPAFALRITFQQGTGGITGNNRFDNLTVEGEAASANYNSWKSTSFPNPADRENLAISGPNASPSGDGIANLVRYALGVGPYQPVTPLLPGLLKTAGQSKFRFRYDPTKTDLIWRVKATNTLTAWNSVLFDSTTSQIPAMVDGWLSVAMPNTLGTGPATDPKMFMRLEVQLISP
jgi:Lamin Tail Domain/CotH kinase protein